MDELEYDRAVDKFLETGYWDNYEAEIRYQKEVDAYNLKYIDKATESDIVELLSSYAAKYKQLKKEYFSLPEEIELINKQIKEEQALFDDKFVSPILLETKNVAAYCIKGSNNEYLKHEFNIRHYDSLILEINEAIKHAHAENITMYEIHNGSEEDKEKIVIRIEQTEFKTNKDNFLREILTTDINEIKDDFETCNKNIKQIKGPLVAQYHKIKDLKKESHKLQTEINSTVAKAKFDDYMAKYNIFNAEFVKDAQNRVLTYIKKAPESELKETIKKSLKEARSGEKDLVSPATLVKLLADIDAGLVNLGEGKGNSADANSNKGME